MKTYIGIDNGVSGTIGIIYSHGKTEFVKTPVKKEQSYTKKKQEISRVVIQDLYEILNIPTDVFALVERPMVNGTRFNASMSAVRALEATLNILELLDIPYQYIDSKEWQKELLPNGVKGSEELKKASKDIGCRLFPQHRELIEKHKDADGILIAEYAKRHF
jgi:hypothetical protein